MHWHDQIWNNQLVLCAVASSRPARPSWNPIHVKTIFFNPFFNGVGCLFVRLPVIISASYKRINFLYNHQGTDWSWLKVKCFPASSSFVTLWPKIYGELCDTCFRGWLLGRRAGTSHQSQQSCHCFAYGFVLCWALFTLFRSVVIGEPDGFIKSNCRIRHGRRAENSSFLMGCNDRWKSWIDASLGFEFITGLVKTSI